MAHYNILYGPYPFTRKSIDDNVLSAPLGNYILSRGKKASDGGLIASYIGRAHDQPVHDRLIDHLSDDKKGCTHFWVMYKQHAIDTYLQECKDYHKYLPEENEIHPAQLWQDTATCPVCGK